MPDKKPDWEVKRDGGRVAYGCAAAFPGQEERKLLRAGGHKIYKDGKFTRSEQMLNQIAIMGRLVRDPELRRTGNGIAVTSFCVAVDRDFSGDGQKEADFINCVAWRQTGEFVSKYFTKGKLIAVSGRLQIRGYTDKEGNKRTAAEVVADHCYFGGSKQDSGTGSQSGGNPAQSQYQPPEPGNDFAMLEDDDAQLPF